MRILIVLYYYYPYLSGLSEYAKRLVERLAKEGYEITVLTTKYEKELKSEEIINGVFVKRVPILFRLGKGVISPQLTLSALNLEKKYDKINIHLPMAEAGILAKLLCKEKLIITYHCDINLGNSIINKCIQMISYISMKAALKRTCIIVANSKDYFKKSSVSKYSDKVTQIYPPINTTRFIPKKCDNIFRQYGLKENAFIIGFVGRIVYEKGIPYLIQAMDHITQAIKNSYLIIAGEYEGVAGGSVKKELDEYIKKHEGNIIFTGRLSNEDLIKFYSNINVLVLPSIDPLESLGMVQVEAMCCGTPVVASDMPGVNEVIRKTGFGLLAKPKDSVDLANKVIDIYQNPPSSAGFKKNEWDINKTVREYTKVFENGIKV